MKITIPIKVYDKIMHWVNKVDYEVSGFGKCIYNKETKNIDILSAHLLKQEGGAAVTDIDPTALSKLNYDLRSEPGELRFWWHSHVKMQAFWSGTDLDTIKQLGSHGWLAAIVFNQHNEYRAAHCGVITNAFGEPDVNLVDELDMDIIYPSYSQDEVKIWDKEFDDNVSRKSYLSTTYYGDRSYERAWDRPESVIDATKGQTLLTGKVSSFDARDNMDEIDQYDKDPIGYEARLLGLSKRRYEKILNSGDPTKLADIDNRLNDAMNAHWMKGRA